MWPEYSTFPFQYIFLDYIYKLFGARCLETPNTWAKLYERHKTHTHKTSETSFLIWSTHSKLGEADFVGIHKLHHQINQIGKRAVENHSCNGRILSSIHQAGTSKYLKLVLYISLCYFLYITELAREVCHT